jgi:subtilisin family serine protease
MKTPIMLSLLVLAACGQKTTSSHQVKKTQLTQEGKVSVLMTGVENLEALKEKAKLQGVKVEGEGIIILTGDAQNINQLEISANDNFAYQLDQKIEVSSAPGFSPESDSLYLAKKDFGLLEFWKNHPTADGRGVIVGVLDDGISPHQHGFITTTTGERKFLAKGSQSTFTTFELKETENGYEALVDESRPTFEMPVDLDADGSYTSVFKVKVNKELNQACMLDQCKGSFSKTGNYFVAKNPLLTLMVEIDAENKKIKIFQPENGGDSHGEGVASVIAGYRIGNRDGFNGVAPGAKLVDYDLSEVTDKREEKEYTLATFLKGLDWLGINGAEVANISYSLGFTNTETQTFMRKALEEIIKKHNMVISFSAGNNGPGLGSLNRRSIYPDNALVAGAFISKELDEKVHGVTGIPEEGRVVYYSSRGPGQGVGPTLISPLSSLTNSSADSGHMAFNGTSSAAPALAGAAAVLISAIKQEGLKVDAASVVHALRLSGKRLLAEPFIFQGNGLPQVSAALKIYKSLIHGESFQNVKVAIPRETLDGVEARGITLRASQVRSIDSLKILLTGVVSEIAPTDKKVNLLVPVKLEYSEGLSGPMELWVSPGESEFHLEIAIREMLKEGSLEAFGEIKIISQIDNSLMASVPVTAINDVNILSRPAVNIKLGAQEGKRFHLNVPEGVKGFRVKAEALEGDLNRIAISVFDTNQIRIKQARLGADLWIPVSRAGYYQVGVSMNGGTPRGAIVRVEMETLDLRLKSKSIVASEGTLTLINAAKSSLHGIIKARKIDEVVHSHVVTSDFQNTEFTKVLPAGEYRIKMKTTDRYDLSYLFANCSQTYEKDGEKTMTMSDELTLDEELNVTFRCMPFDYGMLAETTYRWVMQLVKVSRPVEKRIDIATGGKKDIALEGLTPGRYEVEVEDALNTESSIFLGEIEVF